MAAPTVIIGTRGSTLALWQANWVKQALLSTFPELDVALAPIKTRGDHILNVPLAQVGGKGLFVKEIEDALADGRVDIAVHSMKDMPAWLPEGLVIGAVPLRADVRDVLISKQDRSLEQLKAGARIGTSSLRRAAQLRHLRPDVEIVALRGNLETRLRKLEQEDLDAIVLAAAGVERLGYTARISAYLPVSHMLPAVGQGALCIEIRQADPRITPLVQALDHAPSRIAVTAERALLRRLEGSCQIPIAAWAELDGTQLQLTGMVAALDGRRVIQHTLRGAADRAEQIGLELAGNLIEQGAQTILNELKAGTDVTQNR